MSFNKAFNREDLDIYLKELAKIYKKLGGKKCPIEIIVIGGAAILARYGFREMTTDIDASYPDISILSDAIRQVGDKFDLPNKWINSDYTKTNSYSDKIVQYSVPYKTFHEVIAVRMIVGEYLIAMKLLSGRKYKNDLSDVIGILNEHRLIGAPITYEMVDSAMNNLYGGWDKVSDYSKNFFENALENDDLESLMKDIKDGEKAVKASLLEFQNKYPSVFAHANKDKLINTESRKNTAFAIIEKLKKKNDLE